MADLNDEQLRESISEILKKGDLATLTSKKIRQILEDKYEVNLKDRKKQIDDIVMTLVDEQSDHDSVGSPSPEKQTKIVKPKKEPKKEIKGSPAKKQKVSVASEMAGSDDDDVVSKRRNRRRTTRKYPKEKTANSSKKQTGEKGEKKKTGFSMPMVLSTELANLMGETHMARSEVVKRMWQIIRERNLMDPSNKRYTICDEELGKIIGQKRFLTFSMMKYLKKHVKDPSLIVQ